MRSAVNPVLSVILPVYNAEKYVAQAIESILKQTFVDFELIIADDGSKDGSSKIVNAYAEQDNRIIISHNEINQGKVKTVNRLFEMCLGKYVTIHDADDWSELERFNLQIDFLELNQQIGLCSTAFNILNEKAQPFNTQTGVMNESFHGPTTMFRTNIVMEVGGLYRSIFIVAEDMDFIQRVGEKYAISMLKKTLYNYRWVSTGLTKSVDGYTPERYAINDILAYLKWERKEKGCDSLMNGNDTLISIEYSKMVLQWQNRIDEILIDGIDRSAYFGLYRNALFLSFKYIYRNPIRFKPYKYVVTIIFQYLANLINEKKRK
jgi:glycosyltransferase involved in cell wall biosynthesis